MGNEFTLRSAIEDVLRNLTSSLSDLVPRILTALVVILIGIILAKVVEKGLRGLFQRLKIDDALERVGLTDSLKKLGIRDSPGRILSRTVYFLLVILFVQSATQAVGLTIVANAIGSFFSYLPNLIAATLVLLLGSTVAQFIGRTVERSSADSGVDYAPMLGRMVSVLVLFVVIIVAISQLQIDTGLVRSVALVLLGGMATAVALSFGLGTRDITRNIVAGFYARKFLQTGDVIEVDGQSGSVVEVSPIQTVIEQEGETIAFPNSIVLEQLRKR